MMHYFFSAGGDYLGGFDDGSLGLVPAGAIEVDSPPAHGYDKLVNGQIVAYVPEVPLTDQLNAVFETLDENTQADLSPLKAAVKVELEQGRTAIARKIIERATVPAELEPLRTAMLEKFQNA